MGTDPIQLLRSLAQGGRTTGAGLAGAGWTSAAGAEGPGFAELLRRVQSGELSSRAPVSVDPDVEVELSEEQLAKLSLAADRAEAAGVQQALVLVDGQRLVLDVRQRRITGIAEGEGGVVAGVDGVIDLSAQVPETPRGIFGPLVLSEEGHARGARGSGPLARAENASVMKLMSELKRAQ